MSEEKVLSLKERLAAKAAERNATPATPPPAAINPPEAALPAAPATPAKVLGRPKKVKDPAVETAPTQEAQVQDAPQKFALFLDCMPIGAGNIANFELILVEAQKRIFEQLGKAHYTFIPFEADGALSGTVAQILDEHKPQVVVVMNSNTREAGICRPVLFERASTVVVSTK